MRLPRAEFERVVREAVEGLPGPIRRAVEDVEVAVQDVPTGAQIDHADCDDPTTLFGLYEGVSLMDRSGGDEPLYPDRVTIFQNALERACRTREELIEQIRITVIHEVGHHLGFDEDDLEERGVG